MLWSQSDPLYRFLPDAAWASPRRSLLMTYNLNNPLKYMDPDGRTPLGTGDWNQQSATHNRVTYGSPMPKLPGESPPLPTTFKWIFGGALLVVAAVAIPGAAAVIMGGLGEGEGAGMDCVGGKVTKAERALAKAIEDGVQAVGAKTVSKGTIKLYHGGKLKGDAVQASKFSTTTSKGHAKAYAEKAGGTVHEFDVPAEVLDDMVERGLVSEFKDMEALSGSVATEYRFSGQAAEELNRYRVVEADGPL